VSSKKSKPVNEQFAEEAWAAFRAAERNYIIDKAIEKVTGYPMRCDGVCFSVQYRGYLSHPSFLDA
jgi:hypothetical protein